AQALRHGRLFLDVVLLRFAQVHDPANTFRLQSRELLARRLPARGDLSVHATELVNIAGGRSGRAVACHDERGTKAQARSLHGTYVAIRSDPDLIPTRPTHQRAIRRPAINFPSWMRRKWPMTLGPPVRLGKRKGTARSLRYRYCSSSAAKRVDGDTGG